MTDHKMKKKNGVTISRWPTTSNYTEIKRDKLQWAVSFIFYMAN